MDLLAQRTTTDDGRVLMFAEYGPVDGVPVLAFHGTPQCRLRVEPTIRIVTELGIRLITYDRPGCGGSDRMVGRTVADSAGDARAILDAVDVERCAVSGGSGGTPPAMAFAALCPERVIRLALQAPIAPRKRLGHEAWSSGQDAETVAYMAQCLEGEDAAATTILAEVAALVDPGDPQTDQFAEAVRQGPWGAVDDELAQLGDWGFEPEAIVASTAIFYDPDETVLPRQHPTWLAEHIPHSILVALRRWATATVVRTAGSTSGACTGGWPRVSTNASRRTNNATQADTAAAGLTSLWEASRPVRGEGLSASVWAAWP